MKFVFITKGDKLKPVADRIRKENHDTEVNLKGTTSYQQLVVTDRQLTTDLGFCVGHSKFSHNLQDDKYNKAVSIMSDLEVGSVEPNVDISCWFNGIDFVMPVVLSINEDRFLEGALGQRVDSMGCVLYASAGFPKAFKDIVMKLKPVLRRVNYCGFMTIECRLEKDGYRVVKLVPYFKYDLLYAFFEGVQEELGRALHSIATGEKKEFRFPSAYTIAVKISIPPFPYTHVRSNVSTLNGFCPENEKHIWLQNAEKDAHEVVVSTAGNGVVATVTARGCSVQECRRRVYRTIRNLSIEDMQYKRDIGTKASSTFDKLKEWKWI